MQSATDQREERRLLKSVLRDEVGAWLAFQTRYEALIRACTRRVLRRYNAEHTSDDIEDLISDIWLLLLKDNKARLRRFDPKRGVKLSSWLGLVATNAVIDALRRRKKHASLDEIPEILQLSDNTSPQVALEQRQERAVARRALAKLSSDERAFVVACYHDERSPADLAEELGVSLNTIYSRKFKVRAKLTKIVAQLCQVNRTPFVSNYAA